MVLASTVPMVAFDDGYVAARRRRLAVALTAFAYVAIAPVPRLKFEYQKPA